jgi:hypothetical protein
MVAIRFTGNYDDLSTDRGYQFKSIARSATTATCRASRPRRWACWDRQRGWRAVCSAGSSGAWPTAHTRSSAVGGGAHDSALKEAVEEISPIFKQCSRCGNWVCEPICWNKKAGLCETCAPDLDEEMAAAQAEAAREQVQTKAREVDWTKARDIAQVSGAVCPSCGAKTEGGKFCMECGGSLNPKKKCGQCACEAEGSPKFCPDCGQKY